MVEWDLLQIVFPDPATAARIRKSSPWIFEKFLIHVQAWEPPTRILAASLVKVPLMVQFWGIPYYCCTEKLGSMLGASLGPADPALVHRSTSSGGLYIRAKVTLDLLMPLPDEVSAAHENPSKGSFKSKLHYEALPQFSFLCGVVGHVSRLCPRKEELAGAPPRYGKHMVAREFGPRVNETTLARCRKRFVFTLAGNSSGPRSAASSHKPTAAPLLAAASGQDQGLSKGMTSHLCQLQISDVPFDEKSAQSASWDVSYDQEMIEASEPPSKKARLVTQEQDSSIFQHVRVEEAGPNPFQIDK
ncbi:unnamed protein product [Linum trigynum]|uniref:DUF4283 domain-containing protein n=1 Tax=Linum trigynum TaxID=586398 RepID=A0AAV2DPS8_9ROSI